MPEGAQGQPLVEGAAGREPARPLAALDQPLVAQRVQGPADGHPAHGIPRTQGRLAVQGALVAELAEGNPLT